MSSDRHALTRSDSLTGRGNLSALMDRKSVAREKGTSESTWGCRSNGLMDPKGVGMSGGWGDGREEEEVLGMIEPFRGGSRRLT